jgi:hypothetical protein
VIAYKFLSRGAVGLYSGFPWPTPEGNDPGSWVEVSGELLAGLNGIHACLPTDLVNWLDDELWLVELDGYLEAEGLLVARRGRLLDRVEAWDGKAADGFAHACVLSARDHASAALEDEGLQEEAAALRAATDYDTLQRAAMLHLPGVEGDALALLADSVELARGGRPDRYGAHPGLDSRPTPAALAANLGFVAAHAAGVMAERRGRATSYEVGYEGERARQRRWLADLIAEKGTVTDRSTKSTAAEARR